MPERYMREVHEASGWRARFVAYEIVAKYWDVPVRPGAMPPPTGRLPAEAAAFLKRERDREAAEAIMATVGATEQRVGRGQWGQWGSRGGGGGGQCTVKAYRWGRSIGCGRRG